MKRIITTAFFLLAAVLAVHAQNSAVSADAAAIVRDSRNRVQADTLSTRSVMVIKAKDGAATEREIDQFSKDGPKGTRTVIVFRKPATVEGTRFLTIEDSNGAGDRWIYLPGLGKVRRVAASEGSGNFMGTDFSYDDISSASRNENLDTHTLLREEDLNGSACYVIQSVPKDKSYQYSKIISWIVKDTKISMKIDLYDKRDVLVKTVEMSGMKDVQGRLTPTVTKMTTHAEGTSTTITMSIIRYDDAIPESVFTTAYLETGRAR